MLGAIGPDHKDIKMKREDRDRYFGSDENYAIAQRWKGVGG